MRGKGLIVFLLAWWFTGWNYYWARDFGPFGLEAKCEEVREKMAGSKAVSPIEAWGGVSDEWRNDEEPAVPPASPTFLQSLVSVGAAEAGTITLNFGAPQTINVPDPPMERLRQHRNAQRLGGGPFPYATIELMLRDVFTTDLRALSTEADDLLRGDACTRFRALTPAQQATAIAGPPWNGQSPCP